MLQFEMLLILTAIDQGLGLQPEYYFLAPLLLKVRNQGQRIQYLDMKLPEIVHQAKLLPDCE